MQFYTNVINKNLFEASNYMSFTELSNKHIKQVRLDNVLKSDKDYSLRPNHQKMLPYYERLLGQYVGILDMHFGGRNRSEIKLANLNRFAYNNPAQTVETLQKIWHLVLEGRLIQVDMMSDLLSILDCYGKQAKEDKQTILAKHGNALERRKARLAAEKVTTKAN